MGEGVEATGVNPTSRAAADTSSTTRACTRGIANHAFADLGAAGLELRFDERDTSAAGRSTRRHDRQDLAQRDERHVDGHDVDRARKIATAEGGAR